MPDWWLEPGGGIRLENAPTHFGLLRLEVRGLARGVEIRFEPPPRSPPARVVLHLPESHPLLRPVGGLTVVARPNDPQRWDFPTLVQEYRR